MSNQIVKRLMMMTLVVGLVFAASVVSANGQSGSILVTADIPFDFIVADKTLPSGKYMVREASSNGLSVTSRDGKSSAIRLSSAAVDTSKQRRARMVFRRYGQQYFLAEVWSGESFGRQLLKCNKERHVREELGSKRDGQASYEIVEVVAQIR